MIRSLRELKMLLQPGDCYEITYHKLMSYIGKVREVRMKNAAGFSSITVADPNMPDGDVDFYNAVMWWGDAAQWNFSDGECSFYEEGTRVISFRLLNQQEQEAA